MSVVSLFHAGDRVQVVKRSRIGHCRTPYYLRGAVGQIVSVIGTFRDPERLAYHKPGLPAHYLYRVRFQQVDLWTNYEGPADDYLDADIYEHWLKRQDEEISNA